MSHKQQFNTEGLEIRIKQKIVAEKAPQSLSNITDFNSNAKIFVHETGEMFLQDSRVEPISLSNLKQNYDYIKVVDGELRFFKSDLSQEITLSALTKESLSNNNSNCVIQSNSKTVNIDSYDTFDYLYKNYDTFSKQLVDNKKSSFVLIKEVSEHDLFDKIANVYESYLDVFISGGVNSELRQLINNFSDGLNINEFSVLPEKFEDIHEEYINKEILIDKSFLFNDTKVSFKNNATSLQPNTLYLDGIELELFDRYILDNLINYNDAKNYVELFVRTMEFEDEYIYSTFIKPNIKKLISDVSSIISLIIYENFINIINIELSEQGIIEIINDNPDGSNADYQDEFFKSSEDFLIPFVFSSIFLNIKNKFISESNISVLKQSLTNYKNFLSNSFVNRIYSVEIGFTFKSSVKHGLSVDDFYDVDFDIFSGEWFDVPDTYITSNKVTNTVGVSVLASLNVELKHTQNLVYEFRLIETVSNVELDTVILETVNYQNNEFRGLPSEKIEIYPIQLSYIGPIPRISCSKSIYDSCLIKSDIKSYIYVNANNVNTDEKLSDLYSVMTKRINELSLKNGSNSTDIELSAPRIFRVQWRVFYSTEANSGIPIKANLGSIGFNTNKKKDPFEISLNVYEFGDATNKRIVNSGIEQFKNQDKKRIEISNINVNSEDEYSISLCSDRNVKLWYEEKNKNGFTVVSSRPFTGEVSWSITKQLNFKTDKTVNDNNIPTCLVDYKEPTWELSNFDIFVKEGYRVNLDYNTSTVKISGYNSDDLIIPSKIQKPPLAEIPPPSIQIPVPTIPSFNYGMDFYNINGNFSSYISGAASGFEQDNNLVVFGTVVGISSNSITIKRDGHDCINYGQPDCPNGMMCSGGCPDAEYSTSGCSCCECYEDNHCPPGFICNNKSECFPIGL